MTRDVVSNYQILLNNIGSLVDVSGYKNEYVAKKVGIAPTTFSVKKGRNSFTPSEVEKIIQVIDNEDVENYYMLLVMRSLKDDETVSYADAKKDLGWN